MIDVVRSDSVHSKQMMQGWGFSLLLHLGLVFVALTVMPKMTLVVEQEPFKWEVALVEQAHDVSSPDILTPTPKVQPPKPLPSQSVRPVEPPLETVVPRVAPQESMQVIHPALESPKPERPVPTDVQPVVRTVEPPPPIPQVAQIQSKPVERQETKKEEVKEPESVMKEAVREVTPVVEPAATAHAYVAPSSAATQSVAERHSEPVAMASAPSVAVVEASPVSPPASSAMAAPPPSHAESTAAPSTPVAHEQPPVVASASVPRAAARADYAWLAESLGRRIAVLTRYPSSARLNGWEGRVVLRAIIRADGHLADVTIQKSSGYDALDRAAIETIRLACPLHMKHALASTEVAVHVPIVYSLSN